jgi:GntR family transcriptional regulator
MYIRIDSTNGVAIWQQIVNQVTRQVISGNLEPGDRLPTVRELAADLRINPNTAARAYQDLERDGIVETRRGAGTYVCDVIRDKSPDELFHIIEQRLDEVIVEAQHFNLTRDELLELFSKRVEVLARKRTPVTTVILPILNTERND